MKTRTTQSTIRFSSPVRLPGLDAPLPPGEYRVDQDEEMIESGSRIAWHRVGAFIHLPAIGTPAMVQQMLPISTADLEAALAKETT
jgi:hypothetical protein